MERTIQILMLSLVFGSVAAAQDKTELRYKAESGLQMVITTEGTAEGYLFGLPNADKVILVSKEKRKLVGQMTEVPGGETADWKVAGEFTSESTANGTTRDPVTEPLGPVVFTLDRRGQVVRTEVEPFEASGQNLIRFRWWRYIVQQLELPPVMPEEPVAPGTTWESVANLTGPDGKPLKAKQEFRFLGTSNESEGTVAWLRGEILVPLELSFKSEEGEYKVKGKARIERLYSFDIQKGLPLGSIDRGMIDISVTAKRGEGEELHLQLCLRADGKTAMKPKTDAPEEKKGEPEEKKSAPEDKKEK